MNHHRHRWLILLCSLSLFLFWLARRPSTLLIPRNSLTVVLPVIPSSDLQRLLAPLLVPTHVIREIAIVCPHLLVSDTDRRLRRVLSNATHGHAKVSMYPWSGPMHHHQALLATAARVKTEWVLVLDEHGFNRTPECVRSYLVHPRSVHMAVGPRGFFGSSPLAPSHHVQPAAFLVPPFVAPSTLLANAPVASSPPLVWSNLGTHIANSTLGLFGGIVLSTEILDKSTCNASTAVEIPSEEPADDPYLGPSSEGVLLLVFPLKEDLTNFVPAACNLFRQGHTILAYLFDTISEMETSGIVNDNDCTIPYFLPSEKIPTLSDWLYSLAFIPDIMIGLDHLDFVSSIFPLILEQPRFYNTTLIRLPRRELPYTEWIGTLTLHELRHWNVPGITLSVITNNRPHSLRRLLESIQRTLFYNDKVDIRINMDQTSDPETMHLVHDFEWRHGDTFIHHRVISGGLLPAVVESWYPHCNDSYGLLLEDDVELSPLSYAWVKMALLRYKYGAHQPSSSKLFGISLYQQKTIELHPTGRRSFSAHTLFRGMSLVDPSTPYLSQIPCSWGALYFPSPWREFHAYLTLRLAQSAALTIQTPIVPKIRSNKWTRSWKKYFIELVYLKGYVMLYPNYDGFASFSTNHLEVGSHVRHEPGEVYERKKDAFSVPLMPLEGALPAGAHHPGLLDLPGRTLPEWDGLPVLDLLGEVTSMMAIERRGDARRAELDACAGLAIKSLPSSVRDLFCP